MVVTGNQWQTVGDNGPEFRRIPSGSVIFDAYQTKQLLENGKTRRRGQAYLRGTAYPTGSTSKNYNSNGESLAGGGYAPGFNLTQHGVQNTLAKTAEAVTDAAKDASSAAKDAAKSTKDANETELDWIETLMSRI